MSSANSNAPQALREPLLPTAGGTHRETDDANGSTPDSRSSPSFATLHLGTDMQKFGFCFLLASLIQLAQAGIARYNGSFAEISNFWTNVLSQVFMCVGSGGLLWCFYPRHVLKSAFYKDGRAEDVVYRPSKDIVGTTAGASSRNGDDEIVLVTTNDESNGTDANTAVATTTTTTPTPTTTTTATSTRLAVVIRSSYLSYFVTKHFGTPFLVSGWLQFASQFLLLAMGVTQCVVINLDILDDDKQSWEHRWYSRFQKRENLDVLNFNLLIFLNNKPLTVKNVDQSESEITIQNNINNIKYNEIY
jgi:hypothetical protein